MKTTLKGLLLAATSFAALPAFRQELTTWDWKSGDPAAAPYYAKAKEKFDAAHAGVTINYVMQPNDQY